MVNRFRPTAKHSDVCYPARPALAAKRSRWMLVGLAIGSMAAPAATPADAAGPYSGFELCVAPTRPSCLDQLDASSATSRKASCGMEVRKFVSLVAAFRACMMDRVSHASIEANEALKGMRCADDADQGGCPRGDVTASVPAVR